MSQSDGTETRLTVAVFAAVLFCLTAVMVIAVYIFVIFRIEYQAYERLLLKYDKMAVVVNDLKKENAQCAAISKTLEMSCAAERAECAANLNSTGAKHGACLEVDQFLTTACASEFRRELRKLTKK